MRKARRDAQGTVFPANALPQPLEQLRVGVYASSLLRLQFSQVVLYGFRGDECRRREAFLPGETLPECSGAALSGG